MEPSPVMDLCPMKGFLITARQIKECFNKVSFS